MEAPLVEIQLQEGDWVDKLSCPKGWLGELSALSLSAVLKPKEEEEEGENPGGG